MLKFSRQRILDYGKQSLTYCNQEVFQIPPGFLSELGRKAIEKLIRIYLSFIFKALSVCLESAFFVRNDEEKDGY